MNECVYCERVYSNPQSLSSHINNRHRLTVLYRPEVTDARDYTILERRGGYKGFFKCPICFIDFPLVSSFRRHGQRQSCNYAVKLYGPAVKIRTATRDTNAPAYLSRRKQKKAMTCQICKQEFPDQVALSAHHDVQHNTWTCISLVVAEDFIQELVFYRQGESFICPACSLEINHSENFTDHVRSHSPCTDKIRNCYSLYQPAKPCK